MCFLVCNAKTNTDAGGRNKCNFWTAHVKSIKNDIFRILYRELLIGICMGPIRQGGGGVPRGGPDFWGGSPNFFGPLLQNFKYIVGILSSLFQTQSIGTLFEQIGLRGGAVDMSKSRWRAR